MQFADDIQMVSEGDALSYGQVLRKYMLSEALLWGETVTIGTLPVSNGFDKLVVEWWVWLVLIFQGLD